MMETSDLSATIRFYENIMGFTLDNYSEEMGWAHLSLGEVSLMFTRHNEQRGFTSPVMSGSFYIITPDVEYWWNKLREVAQVAYPLEKFDYGMLEFAIYDNNGYLLQFAQSLYPENN